MTDEQIDKLCTALKRINHFSGDNALEHCLGPCDAEGSFVSGVHDIAAALDRIALAIDSVAEALTSKGG